MFSLKEAYPEVCKTLQKEFGQDWFLNGIFNAPGSFELDIAIHVFRQVHGDTSARKLKSTIKKGKKQWS